MILPRSKIEQRVISYYLLNPKARHYVRQLARILGVDASNLQKKLVDLEREQFLLSQEEGKQKYFQLNKDFPLLKEYTSAFQKLFGIEREIREACRSVKGLESAYLFGSYAKGNMDHLSDLDLLVIGNHGSIELAKKIALLEKTFHREINFVEYTPEEFQKRKKKDSFLRDIFSNKTVQLL